MTAKGPYSRLMKNVGIDIEAKNRFRIAQENQALKRGQTKEQAKKTGEFLSEFYSHNFRIYK